MIVYLRFYPVVRFNTPQQAAGQFIDLRRVAQPGSALPWGGRGRGFKSRHADPYS